MAVAAGNVVGLGKPQQAGSAANPSRSALQFQEISNGCLIQQNLARLIAAYIRRAELFVTKHLLIADFLENLFGHRCIREVNFQLVALLVTHARGWSLVSK